MRTVKRHVKRPMRAYNLKLRQKLILKISNHVKRFDLTQAKTAKLLKITQPRLNDLLRGKVENFRIDSLINILATLGYKVNLTIPKSKNPNANN